MKLKINGETVKRTAELLDILISGHKLTEDELDQIVIFKIEEDLHLEYKNVAELGKRGNKPTQTIREYVSGFANSAGGILIIGIDEATWTVTGHEAPGTESLDQWASKCIEPIAPYFSPPPKFYEINHSKGKVLVVVVNRSLKLVPCIDKGEIAYYFRLHNQTLKAPEYLVADIVLGRRQQPTLKVREIRLAELHLSTQFDDVLVLSFAPILKIDNDSLFWAENIRLGIICYEYLPQSLYSSLSQQINSYLDLEHPNEHYPSVDKISITHKATEIDYLAPFDGIEKKFSPSRAPHKYSVVLRIRTKWYRQCTFYAALYVLAKGSTPDWYQIEINIADLHDAVNKGRQGTNLFDSFVRVIPLYESRAKVAYDFDEKS